MNGDSRETGKLTPEGKPDPSVFSTDYNREGIRVGTAVCVIVRKPAREKKPTVRFRHFWGASKRADLLHSLNTKRFDAAYTRVEPRPENRYSFRPEDVADHYTDWPQITDLCAVAASNGLMEKRGGALIDTDRDKLEARMRDYFDAHIPWQEYKGEQKALTQDAARFSAKDARGKAINAESFDSARICRYALRAFDTRWCYYTPVRPVWNEPRPAFWAQHWKGNSFFITRPAGVASPEGVPFCFTRALGDNDALRGHAYYIPLRLLNGQRLTRSQHATLFDMLGDKPGQEEPVANLSVHAREYLRSRNIKDPDADAHIAAFVWMHALAIGYSPAYLTENADGIRGDWPRIPMPTDRKPLQASVALGEQIAALLDTEADVPGVTAGKLQPFFRTLCVPSRIGSGELNPNAGDFAVTAGWGHAGKGGVTMPGRGKITNRAYDEDEAKAIEAEAAVRKLPSEDALRLLGAKTCDVYLNGAAYWRNIPMNVWEYRIGGYQVIKKWLSYREEELLGRALTPEEAREVTSIARRIAGLILLQPKLDDNYREVKDSAFDWSSLGNG
jgi:hypothetical protein